ncbi:UNVERIFIED_CONTAM: protein ROOT PRIMORDIUM defective [Sesamum radiatum]|uniref:Protein ROOT PRIMORDIUM defective n=1 Tax=Sesamum radiatum TaxID=300843 RepID=A0AAW2UV43_SESRA
MLSKCGTFSLFQIPNPQNPAFYVLLQFTASISSLKVVWRKDLKLDQAIENDKKWRLCARVVREVSNEPGQVIPLRYLEKRRERLRLPVRIQTFLAQNPEYFKLHGAPGEGRSFLELVTWNEEFTKSVIETRAEEESRLTGIKVRPGFNWKLPPGFFIRKEMREWISDWMELPYISPYEDVSHLDQASAEMEKRMVGVFHELLSLSIYKRVPVPILGKFCEEYRFSNAFTSVFTRHAGIFYMSLKGGIRTAMLREAYKGEELVDRDPLLEIKDKFVEMLEEGHRQRAAQLRIHREMIQKDMELMAARNKDSNHHEQIQHYENAHC